MSAYKPNAFVPGLGVTGIVGENLLVHEDPVELIQGGIPGEHYHLTEDQHTYLEHIAEVGISLFEPVAIENEIVFDGGTGDVLMDFMGYL